MAVPKKRKSKSKTRSRRTVNNRLTLPGFQPCPNEECGAPKRPHRVCPECGTYRDEQVVEVWEY